MRQPKQKLHISSLLALGLFALFALGILTVLTAGTQVYGQLTRRDDAAYTRRTAQRYLSTRLHQASSPGAITVEDLDGCPALCIREEAAGLDYVTRIYCYDGYLRELFSLAEYPMAAADGEKILPLSALQLQRQQGLLFLELTDTHGQSHTMVLALPEKGGDGP